MSESRSMVRTPLLSIIIPTWRATDLLSECLASIRAQMDDRTEVIVIDNGNSDASRTVTSSFPAAQYIPNLENVGFPKAVNQGFSASNGEWIMALNDDATLAPDFLCNLAPGLSRGFDMIATKVVLADSSRIDSAGVVVHSDGSSEERLRGLDESSPRANEPVEIFGPSGAAAVYSRALLNATGGFDETYFAYYEDVDLTWRARQLGFRCLYWPRCRVSHRHSASWGRVSEPKLVLLERNRLWNLWKNYPLRYVFAEPVTRWLELTKLRRGNYINREARAAIDGIGLLGVARVILKADAEAIVGAGSVIRRRMEIHRRGRGSLTEFEKWVSPESIPRSPTQVRQTAEED